MESFGVESCDDSCSICLDDFTDQDPATVTACKHEYHLQCILEWSQRSRECPICWQSLALTDPVSQELLAAVDAERSSRTRRRSTIHLIHNDDIEFPDIQNQVLRDTNYLDLEDRFVRRLSATSANGQAEHFERNNFEDHLMRRLIAACGNGQACFCDRSETCGPTNSEHYQSLLSRVPSDTSTVQQSSSSADNQSPPSLISPENFSRLGSPSSPHVSVGSDSSDTRPVNPRAIFCQSPISHPQLPQQSESPSFSESLRSKLFAVSSRYKESISKGTRGFKEKLLARNNSMKEISKEVTREVTAGVAKMMERLDPNLKRTSSNCVSECSVGTSETPSTENNHVKVLQEFPDPYVAGAEPIVNSNASSYAPDVASKRTAYI